MRVQIWLTTHVRGTTPNYLPSTSEADAVSFCTGLRKSFPDSVVISDQANGYSYRYRGKDGGLIVGRITWAMHTMETQPAQIECGHCHKTATVETLWFGIPGSYTRTWTGLPPGWAVADTYPPGDEGLSYACSLLCGALYSARHERRLE